LCALTAACSLDDRKVAVVSAGGRGAGASSGAGGAGGEPAAGGGGEAGAGTRPLCTGIPAEQALITDFSDAFEAEDEEHNPGIRFGFPSHRDGGVSFVWGFAGLDLPHVSLAGAGNPAEQAMRVVATPGDPLSEEYSGVVFGIGWLGCVDATDYTGVAFTLKGTLGTCSLFPGLNIGENTQAKLNEDGSCEFGDFCGPVRSGLIEAEGTQEIPFEDFAGGYPRDTIDPARILGFNWFLAVPLEGTPCDADFTVDDVRFF
jgi:hypothetical protein